MSRTEVLTPAGPHLLSTVVISHASRGGLVRRLQGCEPALRTRVLIDDSGEPSSGTALTNVLLAWQSVAPGATHHLVLQDDVTLCRGFLPALAKAIDCDPNRAFSLFAEWGSKTAQVIRMGALSGCGWAVVADPWLPAPAVLMPAEQAAEFAEFLRQRTSHGERRDAFLLLHYLNSIGQPALVSIPNLVQHDDPLQTSLLPNGKVRGPRRTACFLPEIGIGQSWSPDIRRLPTALAYHSPHDLVASMLSNPQENYSWQAEPAFSWLGRLSLDLRAIEDTFQASLRRCYPSEIDLPLGYDSLKESWIGAFCTAITVSGEPVDAPVSSPVRAAALATMAAGPYRRVLSVAHLDRLQAQLSPLLEDATNAGTCFAAKGKLGLITGGWQ